ncbi:MAG: hypothetical protein CMP51_02095 [Flavobacteriales bacterium]|nr:hypothetical protein [Flavobacteriales bacterium]|tara:strand:+ start:1136 stop:1369 length:234 start_codon:yes stop_codon:yes gene_type:complete
MKKLLMEKLLKNIRNVVVELTYTALTILALGVVVQLLIDEPLLGWDPVGNINEAGNAFIGIIAIGALYLLFIRKRNS